MYIYIYQRPVADRKHAEDAKTLLRLMGYPTLDAPCEAEAQVLRVQGSGCMVQGAGCRVQGSGCDVGSVLRIRQWMVQCVALNLANFHTLLLPDYSRASS